MPRTTSKVPLSYVLSAAGHTSHSQWQVPLCPGRRHENIRLSFMKNVPEKVLSIPRPTDTGCHRWKSAIPGTEGHATAPPKQIMLQNLQLGRAIPTQLNPSPTDLADLCPLRTRIESSLPITLINS